MSISRTKTAPCTKGAVFGLIIALALPLLTPSGAHAQTRQEEPDAVDVARTPLEDLNIASKDIPEVLVAALRDPYDIEGILTCNDIVMRIAELDNTLGPDFDIPQEENRRISTGRVAKSVVGSLMPFRGIVREVSGANKRRAETRLAITAGMVRRAYLKGMGEARDCPYPSRPRRAVSEIDASGSSPVPPNIERAPAPDVPLEGLPGDDVNGDLVPIDQ